MAKQAERKCRWCGEDISHRPVQARYCDNGRSCQGKHRWFLYGNGSNKPRPPGRRLQCLQCQKKIPNRKAGKDYCSNSCCKKSYPDQEAANLTDAYIRGVLKFRVADCPEELIKTERESLRLKRIIANGDDKTPIGANKRRGK